MKRLLSIISLIMISISLFAEFFEVDGIRYQTTSSNTVEVISNSYSGDIVIPDNVENNGIIYSVTSIGERAFNQCSGLTSVTIPNSVTSIGIFAFCGCSGLTSVTIPNSVTSIDDYAFGGCSDLTSVTIPNSVTSIGHYAFQFCSGLTYLIIPNSVTSIGSDAFLHCSGLTSVTIGTEVTSIGGNAFLGCSNLASITFNCKEVKSWFIGNTTIQEVILGDNVTSIGGNAFYGCRGLTSVTIPNSVTSIGHYAFSGCTGLTSVHLPNSVTTIGYGAFKGCTGLTSVTIPNSVTSIGEGAFEECSNLGSVIIHDIATWCNISFGDNRSNPLYYAHHLYLGDEEIKHLIIPNTVTSISDLAFKDCTGITSVTIPNSVTTIGKGAFEGCSNLDSVIIHDIAAWCNISFCYSSYGNTTCNPLYYAHHLYLDDEEIKHLIIPNTVTSISNYAFCKCDGLTSVTIPNSVTSIGIFAFEGCSSLTSVTIGNKVALIGDNAFSGCSGLTSVTIPNSVTSIGNSSFHGCSGLTSVTFSNSIISIGNSAFKYCTGLTSVHLPNSVTSIGYSAFAGCSGLTSVTISNKVTCIEKRTFLNCTSLVYVTIPNSVTKIEGDYYNGNNLPGAFSGCTSLVSISIPSNVTEIGDYVFSGCSSLTSVISKNPTPPTIKTNTFDSETNSNATLYIPIGSMPSYTTVSKWKRFTNIVEADLDIFDNNRLYIEENTVQLGAENSVPVVLKNVNTYGGLEFDVTLPAGMTLTRAIKTSRLSSAFTLQTSSLGGNTYKVLLYNTNHQSFSGNDGALLNLVINVSANMAAGDYEISLSNIVASDADALISYDLNESRSTLHIGDSMVGDVTGDGRVNVTDIMAVANYILKIPMTTFNEQAADVNGDSRINVTDIMGIANIILKVGNNSQAAPRRRPQLLDPQ